VVPAFNAARYIEETLLSIARQTHSDFACVVVDDGSSDRTLSVAQRFASQDNRFVVITQANGGVAAARNHGMSALQIRPTYVSFMDADDVWVPNALERLIDRAEDGALIGAHGYGCFIDSEGNLATEGVFEAIGRKRYHCGIGWPRRWPHDAPTCFSTATVGSTMFPPGLMLAQLAAYEAIGGFDTRVRPADDWDALIRLTRLGDIGVVNDVLVHYRRHNSNAGASARVPELCRQVRVKTFYSPINTAEQRRIVRNAYRAAQVLDLRDMALRAWSDARGGHLASAARNVALLPLRVGRFVRGKPAIMPRDRSTFRHSLDERNVGTRRFRDARNRRAAART